MNLKSKLNEAKRIVGNNKTVTAIVTNKGRIRTKALEAWEKQVYKVYFDKGKIVVDGDKIAVKKTVKANDVITSK